MSHTMTSRVFSSATGLLALLETFAGVPHRQVDTLGRRGLIVYFFVSSSASLANGSGDHNDSSANKLDILWGIALAA